MTAVLVADPTDRATWLAARRDGIGASEIASVMGISPWESPLSLYWRKVNGWEIPETEEMRNGTRLEPVVADWWADTFDPHENLSVRPAGLYAHPQRPWQMATPDRIVRAVCAECGGSGRPTGLSGSGMWACGQCDGQGCTGKPWAVLECKWTGSWDGWGEPDTADVPIYYLTQVQWQCDVLDVDEWHLAALGPSGFRAYHGRRDERDLATMREYGRRFMDRLEHAEPPPLDDHAATLAIVKRLHPDLDDTTADIPDDIAAGYARACAMARLADALKDRYEIRLRDAMASARRAQCAGRFVASRSIYDVAAHMVRGHRVDRLNPPRSKK